MAGRDVQITPGMQDYIDKNNEYLARRAQYIRDVVKKWKFDTIAVHGLYSVQDAIEDYQGSIIEPIFMSTSQAYRDSDELAAALAYLIPTWCYSRIANPSTYYYEWVLALLEGYGFDGETSCCSTSSGMAAIMTAVQPFLMHVRHNVYEPRITICAHCRKTRRVAEPQVWDWVPEYLGPVVLGTSIIHGLCGPCQAYFYPRASKAKSMGT